MSLAEKPIRSMREQICDTVRAEVFSGIMTNDQPVREQPLAERFGVSRASKELESVWLSITVRMLVAYTLLEDYMQCHQEHAAIVEAILCRDLKAAKRAVSENIKFK